MRSTYRIILISLFLLSGFVGVEQTAVAAPEASPIVQAEAVTDRDALHAKEAVAHESEAHETEAHE